MTARYWLGVASRDHVLIGVNGGFAQVCHGRRGPLSRMQPGDGLIYYSPTGVFRGTNPLHAPVAALRSQLDLTSRPNWGYALRQGLVALTSKDYHIITAAMECKDAP